MNDGAPSLNEQGIAAARSGDLTTAQRLFEQAVASSPEGAAARNNLGNVFRRAGNWQRAELEIRTAICLSPETADYHLNLAHLLQQQGRLPEAVVSVGHVVRLDSRRAEAHRLRGDLLSALGRLPEASAAFQELLAQFPEDAAAHNELGNLFQKMGRFDEAEDCYRRAEQADPEMVAPVANLARLVADRGDHDAARGLYLQAARRNPSPQLRIAAATTLPVIYADHGEIEQTRDAVTSSLHQLREENVRLDPTRAILPNLFYLAYQGKNDRQTMEELTRLLLPTEQRSVQLPAPQPSGGKKLRLGVLSRYLCDHTIGRLNLGLMEQRPRDEFELVLLPTGQADDPIARKYRAAADEVVPLPDDLPSALKRVSQCRLDILFYPDLGMDPLTLTLAASRTAPVQVMTWGHPSTTGLESMDAFLSTSAELPDADAHYTEQLIRLPRLGVMISPPEFPLPPDRGALGLPDRGAIYGCPQSLFKFHPDFDPVLAGILRGDPEGTIVIVEGQHPGWTERLRQRFSRSMPDVHQRIQWLPRLPRERFRQLVSTCDVMLDPLHFGGGHTSYEAFASGVPAVTLPADYLRGRLTLAMLQQIGLTELAVDNPDDYVQTAVRIGTDADVRQRYREEILAGRSELFDDARARDAFYDALRQLAGR